MQERTTTIGDDMLRWIRKPALLAGILIILGTCFDSNPAEAAAKCAVYHKTTQYVICVDVTNQVGSVRSASNGVIGDKVIDTFTVTTSRKDSDGPKLNGDTITAQGQFMAGKPQKKTSIGLEQYIPFSGGQGVHYYPKVGPKEDSHGCVRVGRKASEAMWNLLVTGPNGDLISANLVEVDVYAS